MISVIVVTYNSAHLIRDSIGPLVGIPGIRVIVVDNKSSDRTCRMIEELYPSVSLIRNTENSGFAKAVNIGAADVDGGVIVLLNPDAVVTATVIEGLRDAVMQPDVGAVAPEILQPSGLMKISSYGRFPTAWRMFCHYFGLSRLPGNLQAFEGHYYFPRAACSSYREVDWATGACVALRHETWLRIGGLTERWFMYAEDIDLCFRIKRMGLRVLVDPRLTATHLVGASDQNASTKDVNSAWITNLYDFYSQSLSKNPLQRKVWLLTVSGGLLLRSIIFSAQSLASNRTRNRDEARKFRIHSIRIFELLR